MAGSREPTGAAGAPDAAADAARLRAILDACPDPILRFNSDLRLEYANRRAAVDLGRPAGDLSALGLTDLGLTADVAERLRTDLRHVLATGEHIEAIYDVSGRGSRRAYEANLTPELAADGRVTHVVVTTRDVSARLDAESQLRTREEQLRALLDGSPDLILRFDQSACVVFANRSVIRATGRRLDTLIGRHTDELGIAPEVAEVWSDAVGRVLRTGEAHTVEYQVSGPYGPRWYEARVVPEHGLEGQAEHAVVIVRDTTEQRDALTELTQQALQDPLTGLPNRRALLGQLAHVATVGGQTQVAVLLLDLDRLKLVNDSLGHAVGDALLVTVARQLETCVRAGDLLARLGGDEFAVVLGGAPTEEVAASVARRILATLRRGESVAGHEIITTASIGIAVADDPGTSPDQLLLEADTALYAAKRRGRNRYEFFNEDLRERAKERLDLETGLRVALDEGSLVLHYQPEVDLRTGEVVGIEALLRWHHPTRGLLRAGSFLHVVEASGLALEVGARVLAEVCAQAARWRASHPERRLPVRMNVSPVQLMDP
ncbi:MAG TPA: diguanylate cyclase, partial [Acidimicrobiales bacterium]